MCVSGPTKPNPPSMILEWFVALIFPFSPRFSQFYKCFLILFHCDHWSADNGNTSMPSKTTVIPLNRRGYSNTVACTAQISTERLNPCCSTPATKHTTPPQGSTWAPINLNWAETENAAQVKEQRLNVTANLMTSNTTKCEWNQYPFRKVNVLVCELVLVQVGFRVLCPFGFSFYTSTMYEAQQHLMSGQTHSL